MNYFGKFLSNISQAYNEINPATLTGAIDVIVVEQEDGTYLTSPFHVRFGKMGVLRSREKIVDIEINGVPVDIHMKLGDGGEAYFVEECSDDDDDDNNDNNNNNNNNNSNNGNNNDVINDTSSDKENINDQSKNFNDISIENSLDTQNCCQGDSTKSDDEYSPVKSDSINTTSTPNSQKRVRRKKKCKLNCKQLSNVESSSISHSINDTTNESMKSSFSESNLHPFSDSEAEKQKEPLNHIAVLSDYKSDSEIEITRSEKAQNQDNISWDWGQLPDVKNESINKESKSMFGGVLNFISKEKEKNEEDKGIYLDDLDPNDMNPEVAATYFPKFNSSIISKPNVHNSSDEDVESGTGLSLSNSPRSTDFNYPHTDVPLSEVVEQVKDNLIIPGDLYNLSKIYHDLSMSLCGRVEDLIANPENTERFLQSIITYDDFVEDPLQILENPNLVIRMDSNYYPWKMASAMIFSLLLFQRPLTDKAINLLKDKCIPKKNRQNSRSWRSWFRSPTSNELTATDSLPNNDDNDSKYFDSPFKDITSKSNIEYASEEETYNSVVIPHNHRTTTKSDPNKKKKYRKVLRLTSDVLKSLNLKSGCNDVMFSVTTAYQGTTACKNKIFLWRYDDKIIISDIDGTITKSDVFGHILPLIGYDWAHLGVTQLYSKIQQNGYKFLYLSARAIGQAKSTRDYLNSIRQDDICLPDGPLLLSPTSLFSALHREVIEKKPEEFKINCLRDIQSLFISNSFFAGFGNKINDTRAYKAVGIDPNRIFLINHRGELKLDKILSFKSSYLELSCIVDQMFPPLDKDRNQNPSPDDYSSFMFWRTTIPEIDEKEYIRSKSLPLINSS